MQNSTIYFDNKFLGVIIDNNLKILFTLKIKYQNQYLSFVK